MPILSEKHKIGLKTQKDSLVSIQLSNLNRFDFCSAMQKSCEPTYEP
jgi:hypothetical protein